jgi:peptidoglycan/xylan/chitin deacetylase (PgdA/CDA1 family)
VRRGHSVENHTAHHPGAFACYGPSALRQEIDMAQTMIGTITGRTPTFFRAPMGLRSPLLDPVIARAGLRFVSWTRRGYDAVHGAPGLVLRRLTRKLTAGDVLVLHDGSPARTADGQPVVLAVLPPLLEQLSVRGLKAVSLPIGCREGGP